jgi:hypothetical protein
MDILGHPSGAASPIEVGCEGNGVAKILIALDIPWGIRPVGAEWEIRMIGRADVRFV